MFAMTSLRRLAVFNVLSSTPALAKRLAPRPDDPLAHFASPRGKKGRLAAADSPRRTQAYGDGELGVFPRGGGALSDRPARIIHCDGSTKGHEGS